MLFRSGGNETQLAALVFADKINAAYNFDGQGFPPDVVEQLKDLPGWEEGLKSYTLSMPTTTMCMD